MPSVTAIVVSYNQQKFVRQALDSVGAQTRRPDELIILDDASNDGSAEVIRQWAAGSDLRPILRLHDRNRGPTSTFEEGMQLASGDYVAALAADDLWEPDKLAVASAHLEAAEPDVCAVYSDVPIIDENGARLFDSFLDEHHAPTPRPSGRILEAMLDGNFIPGPGVLFRREHASAVGMLDESLRYEDFDFWLRLTSRFQVLYIDQPTGAYRLLGSSLVRRIRQQMREDDVVSFAKLAAMGVEPREKIRRRLRDAAVEVYRRGTPQSGSALRIWLSHDHGPEALAVAAVTFGGRVPWRFLTPLNRIRRAVVPVR